MALAVMIEHLANYGINDAAVDEMSEVVATGTALKCGSSDEIKSHCCFRGVEWRSDVVKGCGIADHFCAEGAGG